MTISSHLSFCDNEYTQLLYWVIDCMIAKKYPNSSYKNELDTYSF